MFQKYCEGCFMDADQEPSPEREDSDTVHDKDSREQQLLEETINPRQGLPPLFVNLSDRYYFFLSVFMDSFRKPETLDYIGTSFGLTLELYNFWHKSGFLPVYVRQTRSEVTGEFTVIMIKPIEKAFADNKTDWIHPFVSDFRRRFVSLLSHPQCFHSNSIELSRRCFSRTGSCIGVNYPRSKTAISRFRSGSMERERFSNSERRWIAFGCV